MNAQQKMQSSRNKTITLTASETEIYRARLLHLQGPTSESALIDRTICQNLFEILDWLPDAFVDLLFIDPPYNLDKSFNGLAFSHMSLDDYEVWLNSWIPKLRRTLKPNASVYVCGDWRSSAALHRVLLQHFVVRNRITWEREKGRGARTNWKNASEDIWFCTVAENYVFNVEDVKLKRKVVAPYTDEIGRPKDWDDTEDGRFRLTYPSNLWTDLTIPFWSMPENTVHPTQKPEKLLAKIILASSVAGDVVLDPFLGSGTTSAVAKKLGRHYVGIEIDETYCCIAEKRLAQAEEQHSIQGYAGGYFWERNTLADQQREADEVSTQNPPLNKKQPALF